MRDDPRIHHQGCLSWQHQDPTRHRPRHRGYHPPVPALHVLCLRGGLCQGTSLSRRLGSWDSGHLAPYRRPLHQPSLYLPPLQGPRLRWPSPRLHPPHPSRPFVSRFRSRSRPPIRTLSSLARTMPNTFIALTGKFGEAVCLDAKRIVGVRAFVPQRDAGAKYDDPTLAPTADPDDTIVYATEIYCIDDPERPWCIQTPLPFVMNLIEKALS